MKMKQSVRQLSLPLDLEDPVPVPAETQRALENVLADLLLRVASGDLDDEGGNANEQ
jgi:hypothetical protein